MTARTLAPDTDMACEFLRCAYRPGDWLAILLKAGRSGRVAQRIGSMHMFSEPRWQTWMHAMQLHGFNVYLSVNAVTPRQLTRTTKAIHAVRHVVLDADRDGERVLSAIAARADMPPPSYVLHSSPGRIHVFWRVAGIARDDVQRLQRFLARELSTDPAATPCTQTTRLPGFWNLKYSPPHRVRIEYRDREAVFAARDFPEPAPICHDESHRSRLACSDIGVRSATDVVRRAHSYVAACAPAIAGQHGDLTTFRLCCRVVRGFALSDDEAIAALSDWNARCEPPWTDRELRAKLRHARRYGHEPIGACIRASP